METYDLSSSSSVADFSYVEQMRYFQYLQEQMQQENELNAYISECLCLSEGASIKELETLHEAITDKVSTAWNKMLDFIRRMWAKFAESMNNLISTNNAYLKQYQDIILNRPVKFAARIQMNDCSEGVKRIVKAQVKVIDAATLDAIPLDNDEEKLNKLRTRMVPEWHDGNNPVGGNPDQNDFVGWLKNYFMATDKKIDDSPNNASFNIRDMYNFCYEYNNGQLEKSINADKQAIEKSNKEFEDEVKKARAKNAADLQKGTVGKGDQNAAANQNNQQVQQNDKAKGATTINATTATAAGATGAASAATQNAKIQHQSASLVYPGMSLVEAKMFYEMEVVDKGSSTGTGNTTNDTSNTAAAAQRNATADKKVDANEVNKAANSGTNTDDIAKKANVYFGVAGNIATSKITACQFIYNEYMQFIRAHVRSYVGNDKNAAAAPAAQGTNYNQVAGNKPQQNNQNNQNQQQQGQQAQQTGGQ